MLRRTLNFSFTEKFKNIENIPYLNMNINSYSKYSEF